MCKDDIHLQCYADDNPLYVGEQFTPISAFMITMKYIHPCICCPLGMEEVHQTWVAQLLLKRHHEVDIRGYYLNDKYGSGMNTLE